MLTHGAYYCRLRDALLAAAFIVGAALAAGLCENRFGALPDAGSKFADPALLAFGFVAMPGALQPLVAAALVVLAACVPGGTWVRRLRAALGSPPLALLADLSYGIFLLHPLARPSNPFCSFSYIGQGACLWNEQPLCRGACLTGKPVLPGWLKSVSCSLCLLLSALVMVLARRSSWACSRCSRRPPGSPSATRCRSSASTQRCCWHLPGLRTRTAPCARPWWPCCLQ